jgi:DNA-binding NtrC family response regulator/tetratricopeptide (TPR) repeat protein
MAALTIAARSAKTLGSNWKIALACLATGRHQEALKAVQRAARSGEAQDRVAAVLVECEALLGLLRFAEAAGAAARCLRSGVTDPDARARLRVVRGLALWRLGRTAPGREEVLRGAREAESALTRARAAEALALFAWKEERDLSEARRQISLAHGLYAQAGSDVGVVRCLEKEAGLLRDEGRFGEALKIHGERIAVASGTTRLDAVARAYDDRGDLLAYLGRWEEARLDLERAAEFFRAIASPRGLTSQPRTAMLELAQGDLTAVRAVVDHSEAVGAEAGDPRARGEHRLLASDLYLAAGDASAAEAAGGEALRLFRLAKDPAGECRGRVRRVHALLGQGRGKEAVVEGRRAVQLAARAPLGLEPLAWLALGRALLHTGSRDAARAFDRVRAAAGARRWMAAAARLGRALARGSGRQDPEIESALEDLERWGDRRILAYGLMDIQRLRRDAPPVESKVIPGSEAISQACPAARSLAVAVEALTGDGPWPTRWALAMASLRSRIRWHRAAWIGRPALLLADAGVAPGPLPDGDVARALASRIARPAVLPLRGTGEWGLHPSVVLHDLERAVVLPAADDSWLYVDVRRDAPPIDEASLGLLELLARLLARSRGAAVDEPVAPPSVFPEIVGRSPAMERLFGEMAKVAASDLFVHVFGETGTGKERVARALHTHSRRRHRPFVAVNASSLSDELFESEMFGHVRGAFTGAVADRRGYVMEADGGTLFIDEVTDLSPKGQSKLLRFLTDKEFRRLGEGETRRADVRILTAANAVLHDRVAAGAFREDLMYRLNGLTLKLPPLRERGEDVLLLARHFLSARRPGEKANLSGEVAAILARYSWPGNVRQLENEMGRLHALAGGGPLRGEHLSFTVPEARPIATRSLAEAVTACEHAVIAEALPRHGGNRSRTADALGISRQALLVKMQRYGIT